MSKNNTPRFLLTAPKSGSGKTLVTCGILAALRKRGLRVSSFKCGPDYIDPMFHSRVLGAKSRNLDTFFTDEETTRYLMKRGAEDTDISVVEGVMGYYDGLGGIDTKASAYDLAAVTKTPAVLIVDTRGMSLSALAEIKGFLTYKKESHIKGVILNRMSPMLYPEVKSRVEEELGIRVFGYVPKLTELNLESRHLGLVLPDEVKELSEKFDHLAEMLEKSLDIDGLIELAGETEKLEVADRNADSRNPAVSTETEDDAGLPATLKKILSSPEVASVCVHRPRIAVAKDEAFCFIYEDNLKRTGSRNHLFLPSPRQTFSRKLRRPSSLRWLSGAFRTGTLRERLHETGNPGSPEKRLPLSGGVRWFHVSSHHDGGYGRERLGDGGRHRRKGL